MTAKLNAAKQMPTPTAAKMKTSTPDILLVFFVGPASGRIASRGGRVGPRLLLRACARRGEADIQLGGPRLGTRRSSFAATRAASKARFENMSEALLRARKILPLPTNSRGEARPIFVTSLGGLAPDVSWSGPEGNIVLQRIEINSAGVLENSCGFCRSPRCLSERK